MTILLVVLVPIIALVVWAIRFDLKRRRRHAVLTSHDIGSAARRAQRTPTFVPRGGPTPAAGVRGSAGVSDKVQCILLIGAVLLAGVRRVRFGPGLWPLAVRPAGAAEASGVNGVPQRESTHPARC